MRDTQVIILAATVSPLWLKSLKEYREGGLPKCDNIELKVLLPISNEPIIRRQIRQFEAYGLHPVVITDIPEIREVCPNTFSPGASIRWEVETWLSSRPIWKAWNIVTFGDVVFTDSVVKRLVESNHKIQFWGKGPNISEIFAVSYTDNEYVEGLLREAVRSAEAGGRGSFWDIYGLHTGKQQPAIPFEDAADWMEIRDKTHDVDRIEYYMRATVQW